VSEAGGEAAGGGGRGADTELKTKTPHVNVGKKLIFQTPTPSHGRVSMPPRPRDAGAWEP